MIGAVAGGTQRFPLVAAAAPRLLIDAHDMEWRQPWCNRVSDNFDTSQGLERRNLRLSSPQTTATFQVGPLLLISTDLLSAIPSFSPLEAANLG